MKKQRENEKIKDLFLYRNNIKPNSTASQILETSYGVSEISLFEISKKIEKPYRYIKKISLVLKYSGYLKSDYRGVYSITQKGRWFVLCQRLDGISFLSLCLLAEVYCRVKSDPNFFYQFSTFRKYYESEYDNCNYMPTAVYFRTNVIKSLHLLKQRNLVYVVSGEFIKMTEMMIKFLSKYDKDLESLFMWCSETFEKYLDDSIKTNNIEDV